MWNCVVYVTFDDPHSSKLALAITVYIFVLIIISTITFCVESLPENRDGDNPLLNVLEDIAVISFTVEYLARLITAPHKRKFIFGLLNMVDLVAILPYYIELVLVRTYPEVDVGGLAILRVIRLARVFRIFKLSKYSAGFRLVGQAMSRSTDGLYLLVFLLLIATVLYAAMMYYAEQSISDLNDLGEWVYEDYPCPTLEEGVWVDGVCNDVTPFQSIPETFWWAVVTMTTVGYGDVFPISTPGRMVATLTMLSGILVVAFPVTIIGTNFSEVWSEYRAKTSEVNADEKAAEIAASVRASPLPDVIAAELLSIQVSQDKLKDKLRALLEEFETVDKRLDTLVVSSNPDLRPQRSNSLEPPPSPKPPHHNQE